MNDREFDLVVYGATGFTGKEVCRYLKDNCDGLRWAISGRSQFKLQGLLSDLDLGEISILVCDANDKDSLTREFNRTSLLLNCTGPYRFLGEPIVAACISAGTHYMDITGEPQFMEDMFLKYHEAATQANVLVLHACAFDSVPADLGVVYCMQQFQDRYDGTHTLHSIESFLSIETGPSGLAGHYTTFECAVHGLGDVQSLRRIRQAVEDKFHPPALVAPVGCPRLKKHGGMMFDDTLQMYVMPFMGADASVVRSSFRSRAMLTGETECPQYAAYAVVGSWSNMLTMSLCGGALMGLSGYEWGRSLLLQYPEIFTFGLFSHTGPTAQQLQETSFSMTFRVTGCKTKSVDGSTSRGADSEEAVVMNVRVSGPEPGYVATPIIFIVVAKTLIAEYGCSGVGIPRGGVYTPAAAFRNSPTIIQSLVDAGIAFNCEML